MKVWEIGKKIEDFVFYFAKYRVNFENDKPSH